MTSNHPVPAAAEGLPEINTAFSALHRLEQPIDRVRRFTGVTAHLADVLGLGDAYEEGGTFHQRISIEEADLLVFAAYEALDAAKALTNAFEAALIAAKPHQAASTGAASPHDPMLEALQKYRADIVKFEITGRDSDDELDVLRDATWGAFEERVAAGDVPPVTTEAGVVECLRVVLKDEGGTEDFEAGLLRAVLSYFERRAAA